MGFLAKGDCLLCGHIIAADFRNPEAAQFREGLVEGKFVPAALLMRGFPLNIFS